MKIKTLVLALGISTGSTAFAHNHHEYIIPGGGTSTRIVSLFFKYFKTLPGNDDFTFEVPQRSIKHIGGIRASSRYLFGRTGRPLSEQEKTMGKTEIVLGGIDIGYAWHADNNVNLTLNDIRDIFGGKITNWKELGGDDADIVLVGREKTESVRRELVEHAPELNTANYDLSFKRDHSLVNFLSSDKGKYAIGYGAIPNFTELNSITDDCHALNVGLVVDNANMENPLVQQVIEIAQSENWKTVSSQ